MGAKNPHSRACTRAEIVGETCCWFFNTFILFVNDLERILRPTVSKTYSGAQRGHPCWVNWWNTTVKIWFHIDFLETIRCNVLAPNVTVDDILNGVKLLPRGEWRFVVERAACYRIYCLVDTFWRPTWALLMRVWLKNFGEMKPLHLN